MIPLELYWTYQIRFHASHDSDLSSIQSLILCVGQYQEIPPLSYQDFLSLNFSASIRCHYLYLQIIIKSTKVPSGKKIKGKKKKSIFSFSSKLYLDSDNAYLISLFSVRINLWVWRDWICKDFGLKFKICLWILSELGKDCRRMWRCTFTYGLFSKKDLSFCYVLYVHLFSGPSPGSAGSPHNKL